MPTSIAKIEANRANAKRSTGPRTEAAKRRTRYNAVKHGWAASPAEWPHSSFHRWVERGVYERHWGRSELRFDDLDETAME